MAKEISNEPLPLDFYQAVPWQGSITKYYGEDKAYMPVEVLTTPVQMITASIQYVIDLYGNFPESVYKFFHQVVNPLWEPGEYQEKVYKALLPPYDNPEDYDLTDFAGHLLNLRLLFEKDAEFYQKHFAAEIQKLPNGQTAEEKLDIFSEGIKMVTKVHINQVAKMIASR